MSLSVRDTQFEGIPVRYWEGGSGTPLFLIHGSGPGAGTKGNWRLVLEDLAARYHVIAGDLIGFGESGRKSVEPYFDYDLWFRQANFMLGLFGGKSVNVLGHSLSGALALKLAATNPLVNKVMTTGTIGSRMPTNPFTEIVWTFPDDRAALIEAGKALVYDQSLINDAYIAGREAILYTGDYKSYFGSMFEGDKQQYLDAAILSDEELAAISCDVLMIHGRDDRPTPIASTYQLAERIEKADVFSLAHCGHSVALEHPKKLVGLASMFFG